jgi:hypothetical protein
MELDEVMKVLASFERERLDYVVIGGAALNFHGLVRATEDVDIFVRAAANNIERLRRALHSVYEKDSNWKRSNSNADPKIRNTRGDARSLTATTCWKRAV